MTSGVKMPPLVLRKLPPPRQKPRMPKHPWGQSRARTERLQEQELERLASRVPDQATLDLILGEYPEKYRSAVLGRIRQFLKFKTTTLTATGPEDSTVMDTGAPMDGPVALVDSEQRVA